MKKFLNSFHKVDQSKKQIAALILGEDHDIDLLKIFKKELEFLPNHNLIELSMAETLPSKSYKAVISKDLDKVYSQSGDPQQFYFLSSLNDFQLTQKTLIEYVRSFFFCVYGVHGELNLVEVSDDIFWREAPAPSLLKLIREELSSLSYHDLEDGIYKMEGCFISNNALVKAVIHVTQSGKITVDDLKIIFEDLPVRSNLID